MNIYEYFIQCEEIMPEKVTCLRRTSFALRRGMVDTIEKLQEMKYTQPQKLAKLRGIGDRSITIIDEVVELFESTHKDCDIQNIT